MTTKITLTTHALEDRIERITYICSKIGLGEVQHSKWDEAGQIETQLTDTGVLIIRAKDGAIITMYLATMTHGAWVSEGCLSVALKKTIESNVRRGVTKYVRMIKR